ncbi:copper amine oxidase N-terminal domain-containing protein [Ammoniphilus sp. YIM 78166]|uniref:copper amine oxidase N-terminal domain-containing protein n=1 Tax=Ammoniphilus sp. YIM 78166 TaxID=1644106 RepID=UPI00106FA6A1|nr:copper amine oxidase N-terminal domain-containing protein [Ammoniphilus sp. YIM 78166]
MTYWKKATFSVLAASLLFSHAALADGNSTNAASTTKAEVVVSSSVNVDKFIKKLNKIIAKYEQFKLQDVPATAQQGKMGSIQNRLNALKAQLEELAPLQEEVKILEGKEKKLAATTLIELYIQLGAYNEAFNVQKDYVKKLNKKASDEELLKEYKLIGELLQKQGRTGVKAVINGEEPKMDVRPIVEHGRTLLAFRPLAEALGADVDYNHETQLVTVVKGDKTITLTIGNSVAYINGQPHPLDVPAKLVNGRTLVPLRFIAESLGLRVLWESDTQLAILLEKKDLLAETY